jgi:opacity protein-like surface antigen
MRISKTLGAILALAGCAMSGAALADDPLGFYIGAGVGQSQIRSDDPPYGQPGYFNDYQVAWKGFVGIRPLRVLGVEAEYIDFGQPSCGYNSNYYYNSYCNPNQYGNDSHPTAPAVFAVGYLPIPIPYIDIFGKAGAARLSLTATNYVQQPCVPVGSCQNYQVYRQDVTDTKFAYGAGVQSKLPFGLTLRAEYERISSQYGDPDALMVSALWSF